MLKQLIRSEANRCGVLPDIVGVENTAWKFFELLRLNRAEKERTDLSGIGDLLEGNTLAPANLF
jgi:hypothetical protein